MTWPWRDATQIRRVFMGGIESAHERGIGAVQSFQNGFPAKRISVDKGKKV